MLRKSADQRIIEANAKALNKASILKSLYRKELAQRLNMTNKAIEKFENGRDNLSEARLRKILEGIGISIVDFLKIKRCKGIIINLRVKNVLKSTDRRSYKKKITKEVRVLKTLRRSKDISQDQASAGNAQHYIFEVSVL